MGRVLAIDFGARRIGLALSDIEKCIASPLITLINNSGCIEQIKAICFKNKVDTIVIGYPYHLSGNKSEICDEVDNFKERIQKSLNLAIILWDERLSSRESKRIIRESEKEPSRNKELVDKVAACLILEGYLSSINK